MLLSGGLGGVVANHLWGRGSTLLGAVAGLVLGSIGGSVPLRVAIRLIVVEAVLLLIAVSLAVMCYQRPAAGAVAMAALAFGCALWTPLPVVGPLVAGYPVLIFVVVLAKRTELVGDGSLLRASGALLAGAVAAAAVAAAVSSRDLGGVRRRLVARAWDPAAPFADHAMSSRLLFLDGAPRVQQALAAQGGLASLVVEHLGRHGGRTDPRWSAAEANARAIRDALAPRGPVVPREADIDTDAVRGAEPGRSALDVVWSLLAEVQATALSTMRGSRRLGGWPAHPMREVTRSMARSVMQPDAETLRFAAQRALALGLGALAIGLTAADQSAYWITVTMATVLVASAPSTVGRVARRTLGTLLGVVLAIGLSVVLPAHLLIPWTAVALLALALVWSPRDNAVQNVFMAALMVLLYGVPAGEVGRFAGLRLVDVVMGGVLAFVVARIVLPVRPSPDRRFAAYAATLRDVASELRTYQKAGERLPLGRLAARVSAVDSAHASCENDVALLPDARQAAWRSRLAELDATGHRLLAVALVLARLSAMPPGSDAVMTDVIESVDRLLPVG